LNDIILSTQNGEPVASSREVAKHFGKAHKHVLDTIKNKTAENSALLEMFHLTEYTTSQNKKLPMYLMNRDGFSFLVMGFTGKKADEWKLKYIEAFNQMEKQLAAQHKEQQAVQDENIQQAIDQLIAARKQLDEHTVFLDECRKYREKNKESYLIAKATYAKDCNTVRTMEEVVRRDQLYMTSTIDNLTIVAKGYPAYLALMNDILADAIEKKE